MLEFGLGRRKIYFLELNWSNFLFALLFRLAGIQVYYLTLSSSWQKESKIQKLNELGIIWLNYQIFNIKKTGHRHTNGLSGFFELTRRK